MAADDDPFGDADGLAAIDALEEAVDQFLDAAAQEDADRRRVLQILARTFPRLTHLDSFRAELESAGGRVDTPGWARMPDPVYWDDSGRPFTVIHGESVWLERQAQDQHPLLDYVGFGRRFGARAIDVVFIYALAFGAAVVLGLFAGITGNQALIARMSGDVSAAGFAAALVASLLFYVVAEAVHGSTPGKMILGMSVRSEDGGPCTVWQAAKRSLGFYVVDSILWGIPAAFCMRRSPLQQRIGDLWAKTVVVRTHSLPVEQRRSGALFAGATLAASLCYVSLITLSWFL